MNVEYREVNEDNYQDASIDDWQHHFDRIYGERNRETMEQTPEVAWLRVLENASKVAESLRRYKYGEAMKSISHMFCWLSGFCSLTKRKLGEIVWAKYPFVCPHCRIDTEKKIKSCMCLGHREEQEEKPSHMKEQMINEELLAIFRKQFADKKPTTLDGWVSMFDELYGNSNYSASVEHIGFHLMEEIGEVSRALRRKREFQTRPQDEKEEWTDLEMAKKQFEIDLDHEIADVFSWICALIGKITWIADAIVNLEMTFQLKLLQRPPLRLEVPSKFPGIRLSDFVHDVYGKGCPNCRKPKCSKDCFLTECKFLDDEKNCGFDWKGRDLCLYGKNLNQSLACGRVSIG